MKKSKFSRVLYGLIIPYIFLTLSITIPVAIYHWANSLYNGLYITTFSVVFLLVGALLNTIIGYFSIKRSLVIKFVFTFVTLILFTCIYIPGIICTLICAFLFPVIVSHIISVLSSASLFSIGVFISQKGNIKAFTKCKKKIVIMNHRSSIDYLLSAFIGGFTNWRVMIGRNLWKNKFFAKFFDLVGLPIYREEESAKLRASAALNAKSFLINTKNSMVQIYPEGQRNRGEGMLHFLNGAAALAISLKDSGETIPIFPVVLHGADKIRKPGPQDKSSFSKDPLLKFALRFAKAIFSGGIAPGRVRIQYLDPVYPGEQETKEELTIRLYDLMSDAYSKK